MEPFYHIVDDALTEEQMSAMKDYSEHSFHAGDLHKYHNVEPFHPIVEIASQYYKLDNAKYYEVWQQNNDRPKGWHQDKDEVLFQNMDMLSFPLCSTIYYLHVGDDLEKGRLLIQHPDTGKRDYVQPITNRLVIFGPAINHYVEPFTGTRHSVMCNPWPRMIGRINYRPGF